MPIARRYILANIPESRRGRATETLVITLTADAGTVDIVTEADLGGAIVGSWMYGKVVQTTRVDSLSDLEIVYGTPTPDEQNIPPPMTELVLAIDITSSMGGRLAGGKKKIDVVKDAAQDLVDTITAGDSSAVAIGLVPWHYRVRFDSGMRQRWENNSWAQYPKSGDPPSPRRYYPYAYKDSYKQIPRSSNSGWYPDPYLETNAGEWRDLPDKGNTSWARAVLTSVGCPATTRPVSPPFRQQRQSPLLWGFTPPRPRIPGITPSLSPVVPISGVFRPQWRYGKQKIGSVQLSVHAHNHAADN